MGHSFLYWTTTGKWIGAVLLLITANVLAAASLLPLRLGGAALLLGIVGATAYMLPYACFAGGAKLGRRGRVEGESWGRTCSRVMLIAISAGVVVLFLVGYALPFAEQHVLSTPSHGISPPVSSLTLSQLAGAGLRGDLAEQLDRSFFVRLSVSALAVLMSILGFVAGTVAGILRRSWIAVSTQWLIGLGTTFAVLYVFSALRDTGFTKTAQGFLPVVPPVVVLLLATPVLYWHARRQGAHSGPFDRRT